MARKPGPRRNGHLTTDAIVAKALGIADGEGIEQVSFRRLARELDVTPMALYGHVRDKSDLLNRMADSLLAEIEVPIGPDLEWGEKLRRGLKAFHVLAERHPAAGVLIARPMASPAAMRVTDTLLALLQDAGFSPEESVRLVQVLVGMILGPIVLSAGYGRFAGQTDQWSAQEFERYRAFVEGLSAGEYPTLMQVLPIMLDWRGDPERQNALAIELLVAGLRSLASH